MDDNYLIDHPFIANITRISQLGITMKKDTRIMEIGRIRGELFSELLSAYYIPHLGEEYLDLLESAGIDTIESLSKQKPSNLYSVLKEINSEKKIVTRLPSKTTLDSWIKFASDNISKMNLGKWHENALNLGYSQINLLSIDKSIEDKTITPIYLQDVIVPYLSAIEGLQKVVNELKGFSEPVIIIKQISKFSPISISIEGAADAIRLIVEIFSKWRREHAKILSDLAISEKEIEIELKKADVLEKRARANKERAEAERIREDAILLKTQRQEAQLLFDKEKLLLCMEIINIYSPNLLESERINKIIGIMPHVELILSSELEISK